MEMTISTYRNNLAAAVKKSSVSIASIDEAARRILLRSITSVCSTIRMLILQNQLSRPIFLTSAR